MFVAGATGVVGWRAVRELVAAGHDVTGLARSPARQDALAALGAHGMAADPFDPRSLRAAFEDQEAVVNLMTHIPAVKQLARPGAWAENDRLRRVADGLVAAAARTAGARRLVQESVVFNYPDCGDVWIGEDTPLDPVGAPATAALAEGSARPFGDAVILRLARSTGRAPTRVEPRSRTRAGGGR